MVSSPSSFNRLWLSVVEDGVVCVGEEYGELAMEIGRSAVFLGLRRVEMG